MKLIQLCGAGRAGKSTIANILYDLASDNNYIPVILPFAKPLKEEAVQQGFSKEEDPEKYRAYCQKWGAGRRKEDPDYWVKKVHKNIEDLIEVESALKQSGEEKFEHLIIQDDVRYMNEIAYGREMNAYQIFVTTGDRTLPELGEDWRNHESEELANNVEMGNKDYTDIFHEYIVNSDPIPELVDHIKNRFYTWITEEEQSKDEVTQEYINGMKANDYFLHLHLLQNEIEKISGLLEEIEDEFERRENNDDDEEFKEGAD